MSSATVGGSGIGSGKTWGHKIKRAGPSHKPHPKATCPHPTRPLRPAGSRARDDYAQLTWKMQPKLKLFSLPQNANFVASIESLFVIDPINLSAAKLTRCYATKR